MEEARLLPSGMLFGIDIGGTLAKIVFREPHEPQPPTMSEQIIRLNKYFMSHHLFPTEHLDKSTSMPSLSADVLPNQPNTKPVSKEEGDSVGPLGSWQEEGGVGKEEPSAHDSGGAEDASLFISDEEYGGVFGGNLRFRRLETSQIDLLFNVLRQERRMNPHEVTQWKIYATGGGSIKYETRFKDMGIRVRKSDEMETIVSGVLFAIDNIPDECFTWVPPSEVHEGGGASVGGEGRRQGNRQGAAKATAAPKVNDKELVYKTIAVGKHEKPWLVVNVGSGVSMLKLDEQMTVELPLGKVGTYKRVGGTPLGGGTFLALGCLLTGAKSHKDLLDLAEKGNANNVSPPKFSSFSL